MSLKPQPPSDLLIPEETARAARAAFPRGNRYLRLRDELGLLFRNEDFAPLYSHRGQPAYSPWRLALVTVMQFMENLSDRQAAEAVRARLDWKYALALPLADPGFDHNVLSEFRGRLARAGAERRAACQRARRAARPTHASLAPTATSSWMNWRRQESWRICFACRRCAFCAGSGASSTSVPGRGRCLACAAGPA